ncbi:hypothetical protein PRZ48_003876 [Zasmidium cellare]|uniref:Major facilitator superfamily (MFS) profile domain-containing protein n=1 Tax=Zasmidium cellare TaxID=395010 RepID=A0ABR0EXU8_ZASCE|nr:hypothetical protein PRZ48_003876 [Zasmidium cellare]
MAQKTAILCLYLNIMSSNDVCRWFTIATMVMVNVGGLTLTLLSAFRCHTLGAALNISSAPGVGKCISLLTIYLSSAPLNIVTDIVILLIPMPLLTSLRLPGSQKAAIIFVFSVGIFIAAVDVVRIAYLERASQSILQSVFEGAKNDHPGDSPDDFTWFASYSYMWSVVEVHVGIMCSCVPALKPLVQRVFSKRPQQVNEIAEDSQWLQNFGADAESDKEMTWREVFAPPHKHDLGSVHIEMKSPDLVVHHNEGQASAWPALFEHGRLSVEPSSPGPSLEPVMSRTSTRKSLTELSARQSLAPGIAISVLFLIWGFEYGVLSVLNDVFRKAAHLSPGQLTALHSSYYIGYLVGPLSIGYPILKRWDFKTCGVAGLAIYAVGTLVFWPAAVLNSFPVYFISNFIAGSGLSMVEVAADTLILLCGPDRFAEVRLCFSQGVQAVGTVVAPLILQQAFRDSVSPANTLVQTQWAYLGVAMIATLLAVIYFALPFA